MITVDFEKLGLFEGARVLDVGCGRGRHATTLQTLPQKLNVVGLDLDFEDAHAAAGMLKANQEAGYDGGGQWLVTLGDGTRLPFEDNTFDAVICSEVLEHIPDHPAAVAELVRVLKDGGVLAVSVPRWFPERVCWMLSHEYHNTPGGHIRIFKKNELRQCVAGAGVRYTGMHYRHAIHSPYWWIKCLFGPENETALPVRMYLKFLEWDIIKKPRLTTTLDRLLNPVLGKSLVMYFSKGN